MFRLIGPCLLLGSKLTDPLVHPRLQDFFQGIERYVSTSPSSDVASLPQYSRSTLKRVVKEVDTKDMRKGIDTLYKRIQKHVSLPPGTCSHNLSSD